MYQSYTILIGEKLMRFLLKVFLHSHGSNSFHVISLNDLTNSWITTSLSSHFSRRFYAIGSSLTFFLLKYICRLLSGTMISCIIRCSLRHFSKSHFEKAQLYKIRFYQNNVLFSTDLLCQCRFLFSHTFRAEKMKHKSDSSS